MFILSIVLLILGSVIFGYFLYRQRKKALIYDALYSVAMKINIPGASEQSKRYMAMKLAQCWLGAEKYDLPNLFKMIPTCLDTPVGTLYNALKGWFFNQSATP